MAVAHLTQEATLGKQPTPITVNPDHVTKLEPRYRPIPNQGSQLGGLTPAYSGSTVHLVTGDRVLVLEDYEVADARLWPSQNQGSYAGAPLIESLKAAGPVTETPAESAKKVPAKKVGKPQLIDRTETIDKITVVKDEPIEDTPEEKDED